MHNVRFDGLLLPGEHRTEYPITQPTYVNMSELATMAALKITNSINQHYSQQNLDSTIPANQSNMPFLAQTPKSDSSSATANTTTTNNLFTASNTNAANNTTSFTHTNPGSPDDPSIATDAMLSRQMSADATQSLHDYTTEDSSQIMSSSTSGISRPKVGPLVGYIGGRGARSAVNKKIFSNLIDFADQFSKYLSNIF